MSARSAGLLLLLGACQAQAPKLLPPKLPVAPAVDPTTVVQFAAATFEAGLDAGAQPAGGGTWWWINEEPEHEVSLSAFSMDKSEVTAAQYATFLAWWGGSGHYDPSMPIAAGPGPSDYAAAAGEDDFPVAGVTWYDARAYCQWLGGDLPTEAQWELAAKGTGGRVYPWASDAGPDCARAVFFNGGEVLCEPGPAAVGTHPAGDTPEGLHDMAGNVAEWTLDYYGAYPATDGGPLVDPTGPSAGPINVIRGGGFHDVGMSVRTTVRWGADPWLRSPGVGFRCAYP